MTELRQIVSKEGLRGTLASETPAGADHITAHFENGRTVRVPVDALQRDSNGIYRLSMNVTDLERVGAETAHAARTVVPAIEETVDVERRRVETGTVRVHKRVSEREEMIDEALLREHVHVERIPKDQVVSTAPQSRREGDTLIIPVVEEILVVEKRLVLKEEVHITRQRAEERSQKPVRLRSEEIVVERTSADDHNDARQREHRA